MHFGIEEADKCRDQIGLLARARKDSPGPSWVWPSHQADNANPKASLACQVMEEWGALSLEVLPPICRGGFIPTRTQFSCFAPFRPHPVGGPQRGLRPSLSHRMASLELVHVFHLELPSPNWQEHGASSIPAVARALCSYYPVGTCIYVETLAYQIGAMCALNALLKALMSIRNWQKS